MEPNDPPDQKHQSNPRKANNWFEVDKEGLARILERKGKEFTLFDLIQNAWDEPGISRVTVCRIGVKIFSLAKRNEL
jgi:hypothetical protein